MTIFLVVVVVMLALYLAVRWFFKMLDATLRGEDDNLL